VLPGQLRISVGSNQQHVLPAQFPGDELKQQQRWLIRPMQVVQYQNQWLAPGGSLQKSGDGVEKPEPGLLRAIQRRQRA
jgi:hypothetical protein